ncbi:hypothetical protein CQA53_10325 [Helicobacter didelphidarum]|uniref:Uncharacterized protein n=1 Tax=Helicobacter didelphidarum TaxID=2040648 RepID=A0A3D8I802_9HELI|nr:hypothetical protein [Helicobacter didelphidarum]RDU61300.1 hypothetical protein CQA53_10325 [Helicobacter didelphidarum]
MLSNKQRVGKGKINILHIPTISDKLIKGECIAFFVAFDMDDGDSQDIIDDIKYHQFKYRAIIKDDRTYGIVYSVESLNPKSIGCND